MYTPVAVIEGPYLRDILEQPVALERTLAELPELQVLRERLHELTRSSGAGRIVLTGMGSSFHALHPLSIRLNNAGFVAQMFETSELLTHYRNVLTPNTLTLAVSQSGESAEIVRLVKEGVASGPIIALTNSANSTLSKQAAAVVLTDAGQEATVSCKTYLCTLAALHWIGCAILNDDPHTATATLREIAGAVREYVGHWQPHVDWFADRLDGIDRVFVTGRGWSMATAGTGGLILKESTRIAAEGLSSAAFRHGPFEALSSRVLACVCEGDAGVSPLNLRLAGDILRAGGRAMTISAHSAVAALRVSTSPELLPILEILPIQMLSLAIAATRGEEAGLFRLAGKITNVE